MRTTALSALVLLGASLVASAPIRVVITTHQEVSSNSHYVAHQALPPLPVGALGALQSELDALTVAHPPPGSGRAPCRTSMRAKAIEATNRFRAMFGLEGLEPVALDGPRTSTPGTGEPMHVPHSQPVPAAVMIPGDRFRALADSAPILPFVGTPVRPAFALEDGGRDGWMGLQAPPHHRIHRFHRHHGSFLRRVHHALMALGPWEGRAVAFVLGCGIGVLLRMMWVMVLLTARAIRGPSSEDSSEDGYDVVFDDEAELLVPPPQYTVLAGSEAVPVPATTEEKEKA